MPDRPTDPTADEFVSQLMTYQSDDELKKIQRYFKSGTGDDFVGVRMGQVFELAKLFIELPVDEIEKLLDSPVHEVRAGALSVMSKQAVRKSTTERRRAELFDLYLRRHDRINNWDLVDLAAPTVVGGFLIDRPRDVLYDLARSANQWERRTAIFSTLAFVRRGEVADTLAIAEILLHDPHDLVQKPTGGMLREAGKADPSALLAFLDEYAPTMPRTTLRFAVERLDSATRTGYLKSTSAGRGRPPTAGG